MAPTRGPSGRPAISGGSPARRARPTWSSTAAARTCSASACCSAGTRRSSARESAHINTDECGAAERILGTKLLTVPSPDGKITPELIAGRLAGRGDEHFAQPGVVAITQSTEVGTCYSLAELRAIKEFCAANRLRVFLDGARLANAAAYLGCTLAELAEHARTCSASAARRTARWASRRSSSCTRRTAVNAQYLRKQHMQLSSKMRFLAAQFNALLDDDLWLRNAAHANAMAARLAAGLADVPGVEVVYPVEADAVFARLDPRSCRRAAAGLDVPRLG